MLERHNCRVEEYGGSSYHGVTGVEDVCHDCLTVPSQGLWFRSRKGREEMLTSGVAAIKEELVYSYR